MLAGAWHRWRGPTESRDESRRWSPGLIVFVALTLSASLWLKASTPLDLRTRIWDDNVFARAADSIHSGDWLGAYDERTLVKDAGYPAFLAGTRALGLGRRLAEDLLHALASLVALGALRRLGAPRPLAAAVFFALVFTPAGFGAAASRIVRAHVHFSQSLLIVSLAATLIPPERLRYRAGIAALLGLVFGWTFYTRDDSIWLLPALIVAGAGIYSTSSLHHRKPEQCGEGISRESRREPAVNRLVPESEQRRITRESAVPALRAHGPAVGIPAQCQNQDPAYTTVSVAQAPIELPSKWRRLSLALGLVALPALATTLCMREFIVESNERFYGVSIVHELHDPDYLTAVGAISRVANGDWRRYEPLDRETRQRLYRLSPAFAELETELEAIVSRERQFDDRGSRDFAQLSFDIRSAAARAGRHATPRIARRFYRRLATEINAACDRGAVEAGETRASFLPVLEPSLVSDFMASWWRMTRELARFESRETEPGRFLPLIQVSEPEEEVFRAVNGGPLDQGFDHLAGRVGVQRELRRGFAVAMPWLTIVAIIVFFAGAARGRRWVNDPRTWAALAVISALLARSGLAAVLETWWFRYSIPYLLPAYPLLPFALGIVFAAPAAALARRLSFRPVPESRRRMLRWSLAVVIVVGFISSGWLFWSSVASDRQTFDGESLPALDLGGAAVLVYSEDARLEAAPFGVVWQPQGPGSLFLLHYIRPREIKGSELLVEARMPQAEVGESWTLRWSGLDGEGSGVHTETLTALGSGMRRWRMQLDARRVDWVEIRAPERDRARLELKSVRWVAPTAPRAPQPRLTVRLDRSRGEVLVELVGAEPGVLYQLYFSRRRSAAERLVDGIEGRLGLDPGAAILDTGGRPWSLVLPTDADGVARNRVSLQELDFASGDLFAQAVGPRAMTAVVVIAR